MSRKRKVLRALAVLFLVIQLVPFGRAHDNPPVGKEPAWDTVRTHELARRACYDCHSNQVEWPWYSHVAPVSWLVQHDVDEAREHLNFSEWDKPQRHADDAAEEVAEGEMPLWYYALAHAEARLSDGERRELVAGLRVTMARSPAGKGPHEGGEHGEGHELEYGEDE
jgi:mono/diheme cytochrome c family protein